MADIIPKEIPSKGYLLHYTDNALHTLDGPNALLVTALPTYPIAADHATWTRLRALSEPTGMDTFDVETTPYRNGDPETPIVENFHTGFLNLGDAGIKVAYSREVHNIMRNFASAQTKLRLLFTYPLRPGEDKPTRISFRGKVKSANAVLDANGAPIMLDIMFSKTDDIPILEVGTDAQ